MSDKEFSYAEKMAANFVGFITNPDREKIDSWANFGYNMIGFAKQQHDRQYSDDDQHPKSAQNSPKKGETQAKQTNVDGPIKDNGDQYQYYQTKQQYQQQQDYNDDILQTYEQALKNDPSCKDILLGIAHCYFIKQEFQKALDFNKRAMDIDPGYSQSFLLEQSKFLKNIGEYDIAIQYLDIITKKCSDRYQRISAYNTIGKIWLKRGNKEEAIQNFIQSQNLDENNQEAIIGLNSCFEPQHSNIEEEQSKIINDSFRRKQQENFLNQDEEFKEQSIKFEQDYSEQVYNRKNQKINSSIIFQQKIPLTEKEINQYIDEQIQQNIKKQIPFHPQHVDPAKLNTIFQMPGQLIEKGGQGYVYKLYNKKLKKYSAVKRISEQKRLNEYELLEKMQEFLKISQLDNIPFLVEYKGCYITEFVNYPDVTTSIYLEMQLCECSLNDLIKHKKLDMEQALQLIHDILIGLASLFKKRQYHQDIKPSNILWDGNNYLICDCGSMKQKEKDILHIETTSVISTQITYGTIPYLPPEIREQIDNNQERHRYNPEKFDILIYQDNLSQFQHIYSSGITFIQSLTNLTVQELISNKDEQSFDQMIHQYTSQIHNKQLRKLLTGMTKWNPAERFDHKQAIAHFMIINHR